MWKSAGRAASFTLAFAVQLSKKARKNLSQGKKNLSHVKKNLSQSTVYILPKHPHIIKNTHTLRFCKLLYMFRVVTPPIIRSTYNCNYSIWHWKLLYMFRVVTPPIIRSTYNCNYSIWHWSNVGKCSV